MSSSKDINIPKLNPDTGSPHPINLVKDSILSLLESHGFEIAHGPEIETEEYNFDMLNIKELHPARQMHDTFYVEKKDYVLRTHTSPVQIRSMLREKPPLAIISGGNHTKLRFRPSYFPFTEPSAEVDILSDQGKWLEILGCGIVNPVVLNNCGINSKKYSGLAFGLGIERIAMLQYGVNDIRDFYKSNLDFLSQFK